MAQYRVTAHSVPVFPEGKKFDYRAHKGDIVELDETQAQRLLSLDAVKPLEEEAPVSEEEGPARPDDSSDSKVAWKAYADFYGVSYPANAGVGKIRDAVQKAEADAE